MIQEKSTRIEIVDAYKRQTGNNRAYVVSVVILATILSLIVVLVGGSAKAETCNPERNPDCQYPEELPEEPPPPPDTYDPVPNGFSWLRPSRYPGLNSNGVTDFSKDSPWHQQDFVQAKSGFKVLFNGCASEHDRNAPNGSTNFVYNWSFPGSEGLSTTIEGRTCKLGRDYKQEGSYPVTLTIKDAAGAPLAPPFAQTITVKDKLIVAIGDSYGSGEGNPDKPQTYGTFYVTAGPKWADDRCHRSATAGPAQAARDLEFTDPHSSVTFVFLACSGASIESGLLYPYPGREPVGDELLEPQLDKVDTLVGDR